MTLEYVTVLRQGPNSVIAKDPDRAKREAEGANEQLTFLHQIGAPAPPLVDVEEVPVTDDLVIVPKRIRRL